MTPAAGPAYVAAVLMLYLDLPDTPLRAAGQPARPIAGF